MWKAGLEIRPVPALVLSASWYQDDKLTGSDWIAGFRIELPFETTNIGDGKGGFWGHIKGAFKPRRRHFAERLAEPVHRQNAAVKLGSTVKEEKPQTTVASSLQTVTRVVSQTKTQIVLASDVVFVDNTIGSASNPGTYEAPVDTIQGGENTANTLFGDNGKVFVQGGGPSYVENVVVDRSTALYGSGRGFISSNGSVFQGRNSISPVLVGEILAAGIGEFTLSGFDVRAKKWDNNGFRELSGGIIVASVGKATIVGNSISRIDANAGMRISAYNGGTSMVTIEDNIITGFSDIANITRGIDLGSSGDSDMSVTISRNYIAGNDTGIWVSGYGKHHLVVNISDNTIANCRLFGLRLDGTAARITIEGNAFVQEIPGAYGIIVEGSRFSGGPLISGSRTNTFLNPGAYGYRYYPDSGSVSGSLVIDGVIFNAGKPVK